MAVQERITNSTLPIFIFLGFLVYAAAAGINKHWDSISCHIADSLCRNHDAEGRSGMTRSAAP